MTYSIAAFYRFTPIAEAAALRALLAEALAPLDLRGTLLVAPEGINGTLAGSAASLDQMLEILAVRTGLDRAEVKFSTAPDKPFGKLKIRLKREIITFKQPAADPNALKGTYVAPRDWNALISDPEVIVLDTRNIYETVMGSFDGAIDPNIEHFTDFVDFVRDKLDPAKHRKIAMFCTGGVRCEKASAFMRAEGFEEVYHLKGGILKYLEEIPPESSRWRGECFVFDGRVAVGHGLTTGRYTRCHCCGYGLSADDLRHPHFEEGVACGLCHDRTNDTDKARFRTRQRQMRRDRRFATIGERNA
jgi:UPF0176 protein